MAMKRYSAFPKASALLKKKLGGSVWGIYFKIWGDKITTVREKPLKSLGHLYSIPLTDRHRVTEVQKVSLKGFKSIVKTCPPRKMKAWCYQHVTVFCGPHGCMRLRYLMLSGFNSIATYTCISGSEFLLVFRKFWKSTAPNIFIGRRI